MRVLIIDDDRLLARATRRVLQLHCDEIRIAHTAAEAMEELRREEPHVVLTDFELESGTTEAVIRDLARDHPRVRVVLYSASQPERWRALAGLLHATIMKPCVDSKRLIDAVFKAA